MPQHSFIIGILSDTHGVLPPFVKDVFIQKKVSHIIHAGDICNAHIISELRKIAPVTFVRGNMDNSLTGPISSVADLDTVSIYVLHNIYELDIDPASAQIQAVVHGHQHVPSIQWKQDILYINPGSCHHPRQDHQPSVAFITIENDTTLIPEIFYKPANQ